jgi:hypothetical protein
MKRTNIGIKRNFEFLNFFDTTTKRQNRNEIKKIFITGISNLKKHTLKHLTF